MIVPAAAAARAVAQLAVGMREPMERGRRDQHRHRARASRAARRRARGCRRRAARAAPGRARERRLVGRAASPRRRRRPRRSRTRPGRGARAPAARARAVTAPGIRCLRSPAQLAREERRAAAARCPAPVHSFSRFSVTWCSATSSPRAVAPHHRVQVAALVRALGVRLRDAARPRCRTDRPGRGPGPYSSVIVKYLSASPNVARRARSRPAPPRSSARGRRAPTTIKSHMNANCCHSAEVRFTRAITASVSASGSAASTACGHSHAVVLALEHPVQRPHAVAEAVDEAAGRLLEVAHLHQRAREVQVRARSSTPTRASAPGSGR